MRLYKRGRVWWTRYYDAEAGAFVRRSTKCTQRDAADAIARRLERDGADPDRAVAESATLSRALDNVMAVYEQQERDKITAPDTVEFYRKRAGQVLRLIVAGVLPERLSDLRARHVDAFIAARREEGRTANTVSKDLIVIRLALKLAKRRGEWLGDIDAVLPHRYSSAYKPRERMLPPPELWALLAELPPARAAWVAWAVATGANLSETAKAVMGDVGAWTVHVRGTKREARDRRVPLTRSWQVSLLLAALSACGDEELFAPWPKVDRDLKIACRAAGIKPCSTNDLRRTYATWMRADGARLEDLYPTMGHVDTRMLEHVYARLDVDQVATLLAASVPAVPPLYRTQAVSPDSAHSAHTAKALIAAKRGSSCWTRTSDPVINSRRENTLETSADDAERATLVPLAKCARGLALLDVTDPDAFALRLAGEATS